MPLIFLCLPCFSLYLSCSPLLRAAFFFRWKRKFSLFSSLQPLLWSPYECHSLKPCVSEWPSQVKELQNFKLQRDRNWKLWQNFWVAVLLVVPLWLGRNLGCNLLMEFLVLSLYFFEGFPPVGPGKWRGVRLNGKYSHSQKCQEDLEWSTCCV